MTSNATSIGNPIMTGRIHWLDTMKVIGMYFIVVGHMFPDGYKSIYAFSVPLFFVVSGILSKIVTDYKVFWTKLVKSLIIPMALMCLLSLMLFIVREHKPGLLNPMELAKWFAQIVLGFQGGVITSSLPALNACWFIYTLAIIKIVFNFCPIKAQYFIVAPGCIIVSIIWHQIGFTVPSAWTDAVLAYPFFIIGYLMKNYITELDNHNVNNLYGWFGAVLSIIILIVIPNFNDWPMMYQNQYGNNYVLFLIGAFSGIYLIYFVSKLIGDKAKKYIIVLSIGNILTLGIHPYFVQIYNHFHIVSMLPALISGLMIMTVMYPIILLAMRYFPIIIGRSYKPLAAKA